MNKKLIKQLEGLGFAGFKNSNSLSLRINEWEVSFRKRDSHLWFLINKILGCHQ